MHAQEQTTYNKRVSKGILRVCFKNIYKDMHECMQTHAHRYACVSYKDISLDVIPSKHYISVLISNGLISLYTSNSWKLLWSSSVTTSPAVLYQFQYYGLKADFISSVSMDGTRHL